MHALFSFGVDHYVGPAAMRAGQAFCRAEQTADNGPFSIHLAAITAQVRATEIRQCSVVLGVAFNGKPCGFFARGGYRATTIMAAWYAFKRRYFVS